jgi:ABC-type multidrug transport system permease subunit
MSSSEIIVRLVVGLAIGLAISVACYAVLSTFIWGWLSAILALIATYFVRSSEVGLRVDVLAGDCAANACASVLNAFRSLRGEA